jgi:hypothetical protein
VEFMDLKEKHGVSEVAAVPAPVPHPVPEVKFLDLAPTTKEEHKEARGAAEAAGAHGTVEFLDIQAEKKGIARRLRGTA